MIVGGEACIKKVADLSDRRELRNFMRFLRLWPHHSFDMIQRPRWQRYLGLSATEVEAMNSAALRRALPTNGDA